MRARADGNDLLRMMAGASELLAVNVARVNSLNVFPVPDGDTGTNMYLTLKEVLRTARADESVKSSAGRAAKVMAASALREARGNSGVILSQFFKGIAVGLEGLDGFGPPEFARCLRLASDHAYKSVGNPVEGTILTVMRRVAEEAELHAERGRSLDALMERVCKAARKAVEETPSMLPVLAQAGVVDAGGHGMYIVLEGARRALAGIDRETKVLPVPGMSGSNGRAARVAEAFLATAEDELYGFCTQILVTGSGLQVDIIRTKVETLARSVVVVGDTEAVKVHGHTEDPDGLVAYTRSLGAVSQVKVQDMDEQKKEFSAMHRAPAKQAQPLGVVAVASGEGFGQLFSSLGADCVVDGGDTMNPSVQQLLDAIDQCPSDRVILLPNNKNIVPAAKQAAEAASKTVQVVASTSVVQGMAAILNYNVTKTLDAAVADMERALGSVRGVSVTRAVRAATMDGVQVAQGQVIAMLDGKLAASGDAPGDALRAALVKAGVGGGALVTVYRGSGLTDSEAQADVKALRQAFPGAEFEVVFGGQPHYLYLASIE